MAAEWPVHIRAVSEMSHLVPLGSAVDYALRLCLTQLHPGWDPFPLVSAIEVSRYSERTPPATRAPAGSVDLPHPLRVRV